jgi:hypothetical protein
MTVAITAAIFFSVKMGEKSVLSKTKPISVLAFARRPFEANKGGT